MAQEDPETGDRKNTERCRDELTGICEGDGFRVNVAEGPSDRGESHQHDGAHGTNDKRVEDSGLLMRGPAKVAERRRPELRGRHCDRKRLGSSRTLKETFRRNGGRETVGADGTGGSKSNNALD